MVETQVKIVLVGDSGCGKSSIIYRYKNGRFNEEQDSTIGASFYSQLLEVDGKPVRLSIWDTAGQERFDSIASMYSRGSNVVILVCDSTRNDCVGSLKKWYDKIVLQLLPEEISVFIAVNKIDDMDSDIDFLDVKEYAMSIHALVFKTSAKNNINIDELFITAARTSVKQKKSVRKNSFALSSQKSSPSIIVQERKTCC